MLIIAGSLVGSSGAILSYIMCRAMNRSFISVILGGFGAAEGAAATGAEQKAVRSGSPEDAAFLLANAGSVIFVPGYGLAVARAQHAVKELAQKLQAKRVSVRYAVHPVAGRMPGHMNVLLAEAEVPYDQVFEMEDINSEFPDTDVALVLGANDVVNPLAYETGSPIYGMPILDVAKARTVIVNKRSMATGYAGASRRWRCTSGRRSHSGCNGRRTVCWSAVSCAHTGALPAAHTALADRARHKPTPAAICLARRRCRCAGSPPMTPRRVPRP